MFAEARKAKMDLAALGAQLAERKAELEGDLGAAASMPGARKSRNGGSRGLTSHH
jgi:hypothetical protein